MCANDECDNFDVRPIDELEAAVLVSCNTRSRHFHDARDLRCDRDRHRDRCCGGVDCFEGGRQEAVGGRSRP